ncbi:MAG: beta galactosidase jelly roll domain-containing protein, partial [Lentisphaeria bacterium]|nr:beta galactosidase jelly roll domain-containing protein [Lentisphaeria bacterium]
PIKSNLWAPAIGDCADIFIDGKKITTAFRDSLQDGIDVNVPTGGVTLDVLVENFGRINYGFLTGKDAKGLPGGMLSWNAYLFDWENRSLPMDNLDKLTFGKLDTSVKTPTFFKGEFEVDEIAETFLRFPGSRGVVWVNGFNLGRYWSVGPNKTLYLPSPILKQGKNEVIVFETEALLTPYIQSVDTAEL